MKAYVGTNHGHGSSAALLGADGTLLFAAEEGKLTGIKDTAAFPAAALGIAAGWPGTEIRGWAEGWSAWKRFIHKGLWRTLKYGPRDPQHLRDSLLKETSRLLLGYRAASQWERSLGARQFVGHHLAHAWSLVPAGLEPGSLVLVSDTTAEFDSLAAYWYTGETMTPLVRTPFPHSIGGTFHQLACHVGFAGRTAPGKLMALAGHGQPAFIDDMLSIGKVVDGEFRIDLQKFPAWRRNGSWACFASSQRGRFMEAIAAARGNHDAGRDLAASAQAWFSQCTWQVIVQCMAIVRHRYAADVRMVGLAGGAALNCQANGLFHRRCEESGGPRLLISPWSDDAGSAIGAAVWAFVSDGRSARDIARSGPFLGPPALTREAPEPSQGDMDCAAQALLAGEVIALASGRLEFGPRALGGRCILADARRPELRDRLNRIKGRPAFMPFAPAVLGDEYDAYFHGSGSDCMAWAVLARDRAIREVPAAVHADGTARIQTVNHRSTPVLARLLEALRAAGGPPMALLTSLNGSGEAVPVDAASSIVRARALGLDGILTDEGWNDWHSH